MCLQGSKSKIDGDRRFHNGRWQCHNVDETVLTVVGIYLLHIFLVRRQDSLVVMHAPPDIHTKWLVEWYVKKSIWKGLRQYGIKCKLWSQAISSWVKLIPSVTAVLDLLGKRLKRFTALPFIINFVCKIIKFKYRYRLSP